MSSGKWDLDALLKGWPALDKSGLPLEDASDESWDARANALVTSARAAASKRDPQGLDALLSAPALDPEPGELNGGAPVVSFSASGDRTMSSQSNSGGGSDAGDPGASPSRSGSIPPGGKRQSLKEIAARASQSGRASMPSAPPSTQTPLPRPSTSTPLPGAASVPATGARKPVEAGAEDSGVVNLKSVNESATPTDIAAAEKAKPGSKSLFDDDKPAAPAAKASKPVAAQAAPPSKGGGATVGIVIALVGIAAAAALVVMNRDKSPKEDAPVAAATPTAAPEAAPQKSAEAPKEAAKEPEKEAQAAPSATGDKALDPDSLPEAEASGAPRVAVGGRGPLPATPSAKDSAKVADKGPPVPVGTAGDLRTEMQKAVGGDGKKAAGGDAVPEPAAGSNRNQTIPEQPSQGAVQSAIGAVLGGAKACVSEADEATRATVTFSSSGAVTNVGVTGWAASNGKSGCVVSALKGAKVAPFSRATYSFPVTIRP
jgi:hypothetical protein